jgi:type IV pilus assembly protein PilY1
MPTGVPGAFTSGPSLNDSDAGRKTFYSPDVSLFGNDWTSKPVLYFGTGDREHPRYRMISNRFYVVADTNNLIDERDLLNLTCGELDVDADVNGDGFVNDADWALQTELSDLLYSGQALGFYRVLGKQGNCADDPIDHTGEHVLSQPTLYFKNVYFTSYQPTFDDPCNPLGNAFIYALDYSFGRSTFNYNTDNDSTDGEIQEHHRFLSHDHQHIDPFRCQGHHEGWTFCGFCERGRLPCRSRGGWVLDNPWSSRRHHPDPVGDGVEESL